MIPGRKEKRAKQQEVDQERTKSTEQSSLTYTFKLLTVLSSKLSISLSLNFHKLLPPPQSWVSGISGTDGIRVVSREAAVG